MDQAWTPRPKPDQPERLERRLEFDDYATTRVFLERLTALCEQQQRFGEAQGTSRLRHSHLRRKSLTLSDHRVELRAAAVPEAPLGDLRG